LTGVVLLLVSAAIAWPIPSPGAEPVQSTATPAPAVAPQPVQIVVVSYEGSVEIQRAGSDTWIPAAINAVLQPGDRIRTGPEGRALIRTSPGNLARLRAASVLEIKASSQRSGTLINLLRGFFHFFDRDRSAELEIQDGLASAASLGTDFAIAVDDDGRTEVGVFDGRVLLSNRAGNLELQAGELGRALPNASPERPPGVALDSLVQWTWYFPVVVDPAELPLSADEITALDPVLAAYRRGAILEALRLWPDGAPDSPTARILHAALRLAVGELPPAAWLEQASQDSPAALALRVVVDATLGQTSAATAAATAAAANAPDSASLLLARSYALQAARKLPEALTAAREARVRAPSFGPAWTREAELLFGEGRLSETDDALEQALLHAPDLPSTLTLHGFVLAGRNRTRDARSAFDAAIDAHPGFANAWLGRGLARIRNSERAGGIDDLLVAAALEPRRGMLRSYLGKGFAEAGRAEAASHELDLARDLDAADPTAWFYAALQAQTANRVNEAARLLEESKDRNDTRGLYRSQLLLDQDRAVRSANLARIYQDAGMPEVATREAIHAVEADYSNHAAHLFLANSYLGLRDPNLFSLRYDTPAYSEFLLANLLSPVGAGTLSPAVSQAEYSKLFERDGFGIVTDAEYLSRGAWTVSGAQFGNFGNSAYALEGYYRNDPGQWTNGDIEQRQIGLQWKQQLSPADSLWLRVSNFEADSGDLFPFHDPARVNSLVRLERWQSPAFTAGYHHAWRPGLHTLLLAGRVEDEIRFVDPLHSAMVLARFGGEPVESRNLGFRHQFANRLVQYHAEAQQIWETEQFRTIAGAAGRWGSLDTRSTLDKPSEIAGVFDEPASNSNVDDTVSRASVYAYETWTPWKPLSLTAGIAYEHQTFPVNHRTGPMLPGDESRDAWLPKAGLLWKPWQGAVLRGAYTRSLSGGGYNPVLQLEPTHVAGIIQSYRSVIPEPLGDTQAASRIDVAGLAFEQRLPSGTYVGVLAEWIESEVSAHVGAFHLDFTDTGDLLDLARPGATPRTHDFRERSLTLTVDQMLGDWFTVGVVWRVQEAQLDTDLPDMSTLPPLPQDNRREAVLHQVMPRVTFNHPCGAFASLSARWMDQDNREADAGLENDPHWQIDAWIGYRLRRRQAELALGLLNALDEDYRINPLNTYAQPPRERTLAVRFGIRF
jgi:predicted Zn-dependent protease